MAEWKDVTSYSRDDKERKPTSWRIDYGDGLSVSITCGHIYHRGQWVMHCHALGIDTKLMPSKSADEAKVDAYGYVRSTLLGYLQALESSEDSGRV